MRRNAALSPGLETMNLRWTMTGAGCEVGWQSAERLQVQEFYVVSEPQRPLVLGKLRVTRQRVVRTTCQGSYCAPPGERSKFCMWLRLERHLTKCRLCILESTAGGWASYHRNDLWQNHTEDLRDLRVPDFSVCETNFTRGEKEATLIVLGK